MKTKQKQDIQLDIMETIQKKLSAFYVAYMFVVFPLFYHYAFFDIMQAKRLCYLWGTGIYVACMSVLEIYRWRKEKRKPQGDYILLMMGIAFLCSLIGCLDLPKSIWGYTDKCTGLLLYLLGIAAIYYLGNYLRWSVGVTWTLLLGVVIVCSLQILNRWGIDPLGMYVELADEDVKIFVSTIGQVNYNASYNCIMMSFVMMLFATCKEKISLCIYGVCLFLLFAGSICCCSESAFLVMALLVFVLLIYSCRHMEIVSRIPMILILFDLAVYSLWLANIKMHALYWDTSELLMNFRLHKYLTLLILLFSLGCYYILYLNKKKNYQVEQIWKWFVGAVTVLAPLGIAFGLWRFTNHINIGAQLLWSNYRTTIWQRCVLLFGKSNLWHKLFGWGFNNVSTALKYYELENLAGTTIMDAHNIILNSLVTSGIVGTVLWGIYIVQLFRKAISSVQNQQLCLLVIAGIVAYMVQGIMNGPQILTTPLFLTVLGVYTAILHRNGISCYFQ